MTVISGDGSMMIMIWGEIEHEIHNVNINVAAAVASAAAVCDDAAEEYNERSMIWLSKSI